MAARVNEVCDALVTAITARWATFWGSGPAAPDSCERVYVEPTKIDLLTGKHVWVSPVSFADTTASRKENLGAYSVALVVAERYPDGVPDRDWTDRRVEWAESVADLIGSYGNRRASGWLEAGSPARRHFSERIETAVYDWEYLSRHHAFWAELEVELREVRA